MKKENKGRWRHFFTVTVPNNIALFLVALGCAVLVVLCIGYAL